MLATVISVQVLHVDVDKFHLLKISLTIMKGMSGKLDTILIRMVENLKTWNLNKILKYLFKKT